MGTGLAQTQTVGLLREGQLLPNGDRVVDFSHLRVNDKGDWVAFVQTDAFPPVFDEVQVFNGNIVLSEGQMVQGEVVAILTDTDLDPFGDRATVAITTSGFKLFYRDVLLLKAGDSAAGLGLGAATYQQVRKVQVNGSGELLVRCTVDAPAVSSSPLFCLVRFEVPGPTIVSETLLGKTGDILPGQTDTLFSFSFGDNAVSFQDDGTGTWSGLVLGPSPAVLYQNATTLLAQGGAASPVPGRTWSGQAIDATDSNSSGSAAFSGMLSGNTADDEVIVLDGTVFVREGDTLPGGSNPVVLDLGYDNLFLTEGGDPIYRVRVDTVEGEKLIMRGFEPLLRKGSPVYQGGEITDLFGGEHSFHASPDGRFLLSRVEIDGSDKLLALTEDPLGTSYCMAEPNSTGTFARTEAEGSSRVSGSTFGLLLEDAPPGVFTYFLASMTTGNVPFAGGSQGRLCLGGTIGRYIAQVGQVSPSGTYALDVNLNSIPTTPTSVVLPGDTWYFQSWYRDVNPTTTSNFSLPISVEFH